MCVSQSKITQTLTFIYSQQALHTFWYWKLPPHIRKALHNTLLASYMSTTVCARFIRWYLVYDSAKMLHGVVVYLVRRRPCAISNACGYLKSISALWTRWRWLRQYFTFTSRCPSQSDRTWKFPRGSLEHNRCSVGLPVGSAITFGTYSQKYRKQTQTRSFQMTLVRVSKVIVARPMLLERNSSIERWHLLRKINFNWNEESSIFLTPSSRCSPLLSQQSICIPPHDIYIFIYSNLLL